MPCRRRCAAGCRMAFSSRQTTPGPKCCPTPESPVRKANSTEPLILTSQSYNRTRADFDIHHTLHLNGVYELPVGRGRRWLSHGFIGKALEGWQTGGLWTSRSGIPMTFASGLGTVNRTAASTANPAVPIGDERRRRFAMRSACTRIRLAEPCISRRTSSISIPRWCSPGRYTRREPGRAGQSRCRFAGRSRIVQGMFGAGPPPDRYEFRQEDENQRARYVWSCGPRCSTSSITRTSARRLRRTSITQGSGR